MTWPAWLTAGVLAVLLFLAPIIIGLAVQPWYPWWVQDDCKAVSAVRHSRTRRRLPHRLRVRCLTCKRQCRTMWFRMPQQPRVYPRCGGSSAALVWHGVRLRRPHAARRRLQLLYPAHLRRHGYQPAQDGADAVERYHARQ